MSSSAEFHILRMLSQTSGGVQWKHYIYIFNIIHNYKKFYKMENVIEANKLLNNPLHFNPFADDYDLYWILM